MDGRWSGTVFCWVVFFLRLAQWHLIFFCCLMLCGLLVLVSLLISMSVCKLEFAFALEEGMWVHVHIIEKCLGFRCLCREQLGGHVSKMWSIQDTWSLFNKNPSHENLSLGTCETWATRKGTGTVSTNLQHQGIFWNSVTFRSFATEGWDMEEGKWTSFLSAFACQLEP